MQHNGVRRVLLAVGLAAVLPLAGCGALGLGGTPPGASATPAPPGPSWLIVAAGRATPSPSASRGRPSTSASTGASAHPGRPDCAPAHTVGQVLVPVSVTTASRSVTVSWPRQAVSTGYRIAAVPQRLVNGSQPPVAWQSVGTGTGCTVTGTISGLVSGAPYVVWLDVLGSGHTRDGTRNPYSGRSTLVYPA